MIPLNGYDYLGTLGTPGNFGTVYHARNLLSGQDVAIKHIDQAMSARAVAAWEAEAKAMAAFQHPHIVGILHAEITPDGPALVMEYLPEGSVGATYGDAPAPVGDVVQIAIDACWGLHRLHLEGLTHRDVKPDNLLLDGGSVKLGDFGLAATLGEPSDLIYAAHKPPEIVHGTPWTAVADVYALSVTAWRLLWGDAQAGRHEPDVLARVQSGHWPDRDSWPLHVHKRLRSAVRAGMHPDPAKRPQTAADFRRTLEQARPVVSWFPQPDDEWWGTSNAAGWFVKVVRGTGGLRVETKRDLGRGARRVGAGCTDPMSEDERNAFLQRLLETVATSEALPPL